MREILGYYGFNNDGVELISSKQQLIEKQAKIDEEQDKKINNIDSEITARVDDAIINIMTPYLQWMSEQFYTKEECDNKFQQK